MSRPLNPLLRWILAPPSALYGLAVSARNGLYDAGVLRAERLTVPVVCVGNLTTGGTGKTPLVAAIAERLSAVVPLAILTRGYGGRAGAGPLLLVNGHLEAPDGLAPAGEPTHDPADPAVAGDEPVLLSRQLPTVPIVVGADRRRTGRFAVERLGARLVLLDDGFQHRRLARDLDIVALDAMDPFGTYHMLPSGLLREPFTALRRAGMVVVTRSHPDDPLETLRKVVARMNPAAPVFRAWHRPVAIVPVLAGTDAAPGFDPARIADPARSVDPGRSVEWIRGRPLAAFCGIGNPAGFVSLLESLGARVVAFRPWRDHHRYTREEIEGLASEAARAGAEAILTTEKDAVRIPRISTNGAVLPLLALRVRCEIERPEEFFARLARAAGLPERRSPP